MKNQKYRSKIKNNIGLRFFDSVYQIVKRIPAGNVATYGQIAKAIGTRDARIVGFALHANRDSDVPCHRVVNKEGGLAENFGGPFDPTSQMLRRTSGWREQRRRLLAEGVPFKNEKIVDTEKCNFDVKV